MSSVGNTENNLNNYFNFHVCLSFRPLSVHRPPSVRKLTLIPADVSQNVTNKSCLVCYESEKDTLCVIPGPPGVHGKIKAAPWGQLQS